MLRAIVLLALAAHPAQAGSVVPVRAIRAQTVVAATDLALEEAETPGALTDIAAAAGLEAKVTLYPGRPILPSQLGPPALVERNQQVRMVFKDGPLAISTEGRTLDRGGFGARVRVMNLESRQIVSGAVAADGSIEVGP